MTLQQFNMKYILLFSILISLTLSFTSKKYEYISNNEKCNAILDSARILVETGEFTINWKLNKVDKERQLRISRWFESKTFSELKCLLESNNKLYQFYGYMYASMLHKENNKNKYLYLLNDTTSLQFSSEKEVVETKMTLGSTLKEMCEHIIKDRVNINRRPAIEKTISNFIKKYSKYPLTYKSISFPKFSIGSDATGFIDFNIRHKYEIKNNRGQRIKITSAFILDSSLNINVIEKDSSLFISSYPPKLNEWFKEYGRNLNSRDSVELRLK